jgi:hypothetical protein
VRRRRSIPSSTASLPSATRSPSSWRSVAASQRCWVARYSAVFSTASTSMKPAERSRLRYVVLTATAGGPIEIARRRFGGVSPGGNSIVWNASRPPGRRARRDALSTESLLRSQHITSACTIASIELGRIGRCSPVPSSASARGPRPSEPIRSRAALAPSMIGSTLITEQPNAVAR